MGVGGRLRTAPEVALNDSIVFEKRIHSRSETCQASLDHISPSQGRMHLRVFSHRGQAAELKRPGKIRAVVLVEKGDHVICLRSGKLHREQSFGLKKCEDQTVLMASVVATAA